jgi:hypothetical protein
MAQTHHDPMPEPKSPDQPGRQAADRERPGERTGAQRANESPASGVETEDIQPGKTGGAASPQ